MIALPQGYRRRMRAQLGDRAEAYFACVDKPYWRGLRLNPRKPGPLPQGVLAPVPWQKPNGFYLSQDSLAGAHPLHEAGAYYIQEPSAMAPVAVLKPQPGERVLDLCAAPGGKSTQLADALNGRGLLVCNEPVESRAKILSRNIERMGVGNALVASALPERLAALWPETFDAILADAPCSGEGMFRRRPETRAEWSEQAPAGCAARQKRILASACQMLRPGGRLAYSTCTFNREENEQVIAWLLEEQQDMEAVPFSFPAGEGESLEAKEGMLHLYPHEIRGEGHFVALLRKRGSGEPPCLAPAAQRLSPPNPALLAAYEAFAAAGMPAANAQLGDALLCAPELPPLQGVRVLRAGLQLGCLKGKVFLPDHALAMGLALPYALPVLEVSLEDAARYQRGEALAAPPHLRGFTLVAYAGLALGFGKVSDGQCKNHYPKGLRRP